jgi:ribose 5-phosphate isomerase RpiB
MLISILLESKTVDFVVTGCSSGQGMMLACNSLPSILCGYIENPSDAYLFGRVNNGNAISIPFGLNFGWAAEINLQCVLEKLFDEPFGIGYPQKDAARKQKDTQILKLMNSITKRELKNVIPQMDIDFIKILNKALKGDKLI